MFFDDAEGYGVGLAFAENGLLLGVLYLVNLITYYVVLSMNTSVAASLYDQLMNAQPGLFSQSPSVLPHVGLGILERVSSLFFHFSWGYLCVFAVALRKYRFLFLALPMGLIDALVPFTSVIGLVEWELLLFGLGVLSVIAALVATRNVRPLKTQMKPSSNKK